jgi:hypothetical protein
MDDNKNYEVYINSWLAGYEDERDNLGFNMVYLLSPLSKYGYVDGRAHRRQQEREGLVNVTGHKQD